MFSTIISFRAVIICNTISSLYLSNSKTKVFEIWARLPEAKFWLPAREVKTD